jgi:DNA-binding NtrC family response regulator
VPEIAERLGAAICARFGIRPKRIAADALELLMGYEWSRNNVRELRNVVERMIIAADGDVIGPAHVPPEIRDGSEPGMQGARTFQALKAEAERRIVIAALERNEWHVTRAAEELGLADHASLLKIMRRLGIERGR